MIPEDLNPDHQFLWERACEFAVAGRYRTMEEFTSLARDEFFRTGGELRTHEEPMVLMED